MRILPADLYAASIRLFPVPIENEDPVAARILEEGSFRDNHRLRRLTEFEIDVIRLPTPNVIRTFAGKHKIRPKLPVTNLGIYLTYRQREVSPLAIERGR